MLRKSGMKALIIGDGGIGKTTLVQKVDNKNNIDGRMTILFEIHHLRIQDQSILILDIGGQKQFQKAILEIKGLFKGVQLVFLCFDLSRYASFKNLSMWLNLVKMRLQDVPVILVGTKADKISSVSPSEINEFLKSNNIHHYIPTSALKRSNIHAPFERASELIYEKRNNLKIKIST